MSKVLLKSTKTETDPADILGPQWYGDYHLLCTTYAGHEVKMQVRGKDNVWHDASLQTASGALPVKLTAAGAVLAITLIKEWDYKLVTGTKGAVVEIAKQHPHGD